MGSVNLVTRNGSLIYDDDQHSFDVIDGGTLKSQTKAAPKP